MKKDVLEVYGEVREEVVVLKRSVQQRCGLGSA